MQNTDLTVAVIFGAASLQGILCILFFLLNKKGSRIANRFILAMTVCITLIIFNNFLVFNGSYFDYPNTILVFHPLFGLIAPLFYMYVVYIISPNRKLRIYDLLHSTLFLIVFYKHWKFLKLPVDIKISAVNYFYYGTSKFSPSELPEIIFYKLVAVVYGCVCLYLILKKITALKQLTSNTNIQYLNKFKLIVYLFMAYTWLSLLGFLSPLIIEVTNARYEVYNDILNATIVMSISIITMQQPERLVFLLKSLPKIKTQKTTNTLVLNDLMRLMETKKPFLNPDLKLSDLATLLKVPSHILSDHINHKLNVNFFELINQYRVEEFKQRVHSTNFEKYTLLAIALDVGFNSKASFNRIFKQQTQMTPSQYKNLKKSPTPETEVSSI